jgi:hypothetical protein
MKRTTIMVDEGTYADLEEYARRDGVPTARLIREAMERYVTERERQAEAQPLPDFVGKLTGGGEPIAGKVDEYVGEALDEVYWTEVRGRPTVHER